MTRALRFVKQVTKRNPSAICLLIALVTLFVDLATGRDIRFPLLYVIPIGLASWMGRKTLAYILSVLLPVMRVYFEVLWQVPELLPIESINAAIEALALSLYVYLVGRKATETRQMKKDLTTKDEEMQHLRAFTRLVGHDTARQRGFPWISGRGGRGLSAGA